MAEPARFETGLKAAELALDQLGRRLDVAIKGRSAAAILALGMARQTVEIYGALRREAAADSLGISPPILLRSVAEAAIRLRWLEDAPSLRTRMLHAEDTRQTLAGADPFRKFRARRTGTRGHPIFDRKTVTAMKKEMADVRADALKAGESIGNDGPLVPPVEQMALETKDAAMWEAYQVIYRISSPSAHIEPRSLGSHTLERQADGTHLVVAGGYPGLAVRGMAAPSVAHMLGTVSRICGLGLEGEARIWQDAVVEWPAPLVEEVLP